VAGIVSDIPDGYGQLMLPTRLLEYARFGVPAACSRLAAIEESFPPDALAYCLPGDARDLAAQLQRLLADPRSARRQAGRAREVALDLSWERSRLAYLAALGIGRDLGPPIFSPDWHGPRR
jgi:glycosyltransferase involved in cell wall biosynthesis